MSLLDNASLLITPNAYKEGKLYSVIPTNGNGDLTFTRATTATRVNSSGLVELVPYNLFTYSQDLSNTNWNKTSSTVVSNSTTAPDGTLTADTQTVSAQFGGVNQFISGVTIGSTYNISFWAKRLTGTNAYSVIDNSGGSGIFGTYTPTTEWVRYSFSFVAASTAITLFPAQDRNASGFGSIYIWGLQVNEGGLKAYQKTETRLNIPRLDYSLGSCPNILLEPQRTNLALRSQEFDNATWIKTASSVTANTTTSPDGTSNADSLVENTATNLHLTYQFFTSTATTYTYSCYIKPDTRTRAYLRTDTSAGTTRTLFDLTGAGSVVTLAHTSATITLVGNGWYRCTITFTEGTGAANRLFAVEGAVGTSISYAGNGLTAFYLYGAQLEVGAYATSYIPTTSASVTRNQDLASRTAASALIGQTEGTLFCEIKLQNLNSASTYVGMTSGTFSNAILIGKEAGVTPNKLAFIIFASGSTILNNTSTALSSSFVKCAIAYKSGDWAAYLNGSLVASGTSTFSFNSSVNRLGFGSNAAFAALDDEMEIKQTAIWKTRLTNAELAQLTTI